MPWPFGVGKFTFFRRVGAARKPRPPGNRPRHGRKTRERKSVTRQREKCTVAPPRSFIFIASFFRIHEQSA